MSEGWEAVVHRFSEALRGELVGPDAKPSSAARSTIDTNTILVAGRADQLMSLVTRITARRGLSGLDVLEVGSGFGALAAYLAWSQRPARLRAMDIRADYVALARRATDGAHDLPGLEYDVADMRRLRSVTTDSVDVVLLNNALIYHPTAQDLHDALGEFRRVLLPGGHVVSYQANRWVPREPLSGAPVVHLLGPRLGPIVGDRFGWRDNHGRVRYLSPPALRRALRAAGFKSVRTAAPKGSKGLRALTARFYAAGGRSPE